MTEKELLQEALQAKLYTAEKRISVIRLLITLFTAVVYYGFMQPTDYWLLAHIVILIANIYAIIGLVFEPYRKFSFFSSIYFTTISDGALIAALIIATGFMQSPFYLIWYLSVIAVAFRFNPKETIISSIGYLISYLLVFAFDLDSQLLFSDLLTRLGFIPIAGMLGMYFSIELTDQIDSKIRVVKGERALKLAHDQLEWKVDQRTKELSVINKDLTDSINYAERIQTATLPTSVEFETYLPESFVIHRPKDIISGDFHWLHQRDTTTYLAVVDCTGHGVPGAMMSMIGNNLLNSALLDKGLTDPAKALTDMDYRLGNMLKNDSEGNAVNDGMDLTLCLIDHEQQEIKYEGACGHGYLLSNSGEVTEMKTTRYSIGGLLAGQNKDFETRTLKYEKGDLLYLFSDGYQDQFGGPRGKKFYRKNLLSLIQEVKNLPMDTQKENLEKAFTDWMGPLAQIDDVTVIGIRL